MIIFYYSNTDTHSTRMPSTGVRGFAVVVVVWPWSAGHPDRYLCSHHLSARCGLKMRARKCGVCVAFIHKSRTCARRSVCSASGSTLVIHISFGPWRNRAKGGSDFFLSYTIIIMSRQAESMQSGSVSVYACKSLG